MAEFRQDPSLLRERQVSAHEGTDNRQVEWLLTPNQFADGLNLRISDLGKWARRLGAKALGGFTDTPAGGLAEYVQNDGTNFMTAMWGNELYKSQAGADWNQIACGASIVSDLLHMGAPGRINNKRCVGYVACEESTAPGPFLIYNVEDDNFTAVTAVTEPRCVTFFQSRYWLGQQETLYWSDVLDTAGFTAGNTLIAEPGVGGNITALVPSRDSTPRLWILKDEAVLLLEPRWGSSSALIPSAGDALDVINTNLRTLTVGIGCVATRSAVWVPGNEGADVLFLAGDGVRSLRRADTDVQSGAGFPETYSVQGYIDRINFSAAHKAAASVHDNAYHLAVPLDGATANSHLLRREIAGGAWTLHDWQAKDVGAFRLGAQRRFFFQNNFTTNDSSATDAPPDNLYQVYQGFNTSIDPGTTHVPYSMTTRAFVFRDPQREKRWNELTFQISSADTAIMEVSARVDFGPYNTLDTLTLQAGGGSLVLGEDELVWRSGPDVIRRKQIDLTEIPDGFNIQFRFNSVTGATEYGQVTVYTQDLSAFPDPEVFEEQN